MLVAENKETASNLAENCSNVVHFLTWDVASRNNYSQNHYFYLLKF